MANTLRIKRRPSTSPLGAGAPAGMAEGELAVNFIDSRLYIKGDQPTPLEFADKTYVDGAITSATASLGTMSTQDADSVAITGGTIDGTTIGLTTKANANFDQLQAEHITSGEILIQGPGSGLGIAEAYLFPYSAFNGAPTAGNFAFPATTGYLATENYVDGKVSALGSVFHFIGDVSAATGNDLTTLIDQSTGSYYRVDVAGTYTAGAASFALKVGDAIVKTTTGWQKLDNVDAEVVGTANEIAVTGDENVGYTVALDPAFKGRVSDVELKTVNITATASTSGPATGTTDIIGAFTVGGGGGANLIKVPANAGILELNEMGNPRSIVHATLDLVDSNWGLGDSTNGWTALRAAGNLVGVDHNYGGSTQMSKIENFVLDGGEY